MTTVPAWILNLGIPAECVDQRSSAREKGRRFSIAPLRDDTIWRIHMDGCWLQTSDQKRVDYLFWGQSASNKRVIILVELKGKQFGSALKQVEATLQHLCKRANDRGIHTGSHYQSPGHDPHARGGIRVYIVHSGGERVSRRQADIERIRQRYGVRVRTFEQHGQIARLDNIP